MEFNFEGKTGEELEARKLELRDAMTAEGADLDAIDSEARAINAELETRKAEMEKKNKEIKEVLETRTEPIEKNPKEERKMTDKEIRSSKEYIDAYVRYLKDDKNDGAECRTLLSENATESGQVPVPTYVEGRIQTSWENDEILSRISKSFFPGNFKVGVEMAADPAEIHYEGDVAPNEEGLLLVTVEIIARNIKKWITVSDEVLDLNGEEFLNYIYDELEYQIVKKAASEALKTVCMAPTIGTEAPTVASVVINEKALDDFIIAIGLLSGDARNIVVIANRATIAAYQGLAIGANYPFDIFGGATVIPCDFLNTLDDGHCLAIVGDLSAIRGNFPNGYDVKFTFDPYTFSERDLVKIVGRLYGGFGLIKDRAFTRLVLDDSDEGGGSPK